MQVLPFVTLSFWLLLILCRSSPTSCSGIGRIESTDVVEVTNSAGSVQCVTSNTDFDTDLLFDIATGTALVRCMKY